MVRTHRRIMVTIMQCRFAVRGEGTTSPGENIFRSVWVLLSEKW
jgi:hypothetical protein